MGGSVLRTPATLLKVDALTLKPIKQLSIGGRLHHAQLFQDKYILMDTFISDPDGLDVFLFDPDTGKVAAMVGGNYLTALRTAAASSVSIKHLARKDAPRKLIPVRGQSL